VKHEAATQPPVTVGPEKPHAMPAFVSLVSFPVFILSTEDNATTSQGARLAAEVLSAKFAGITATAEAQMIRPEPLSPNAVVVPVDPKTPLRTASLSQNRHAKARPATKRRRTAHVRHRSGARRTAAATSGGITATISKIVGFVGMPPDKMLTD
jgi:hypothetical protein